MEEYIDKQHLFTMSSSSNAISNIGGGGGGDSNAHQKYHALIIDSGAIIKQTSFSNNTTYSNSLLNAANHYYTVPAVLSEIRDAKSRMHLTNFTNLLMSLHNTELVTRTPTQHAIQRITNFSKKTGDYSQLSVVDLQVLALLYDLEMEAAGMYNNGNMKHVRDEPKRVLGVCVKALNGDGKRHVKSRSDSVSSSTTNYSSVGGGSDSVTSTTGGSIVSNTSFFQGNANGIIDAANVDLEYDDDDDEDDCVIEDGVNNDNVPVEEEEERQDSATGGSSTAATKDRSKPKVSSWATLVNPTVASSVPLIDYSIGKSATSSSTGRISNMNEEPIKIDFLNENTDTVNDVTVDGQFDDASSSDASNEVDDTFSDDASTTNSNGEIDALNIANATSDDEFSDEECDVFILEPHEALYFKRLKEQKKKNENGAMQDVQDVPRNNGEDLLVQEKSKEEDRLASEFPSLSVAATVPYEGCSDDEEPIEFEQPKQKTAESQQAWEKEEEERKMKALQPMVNGRIVKNDKKQAYNSFRKYGNVVSANGAAVAMKKLNNVEQKGEGGANEVVERVAGDDMKEEVSTSTATDTAGGNAYKSRILGAANAALASSSNADGPIGEMTAEDDDGEGWVTCTRDIQSMKATGSLHLNNNSHSNNNKLASKKKKDIGPPISQRAACATTDFAMQNVILQMNLELLSVDGVRVRRLKTWVTRCAACFTIYGNDHGNKSSGGSSSGRLFCDKCGSNTLQRISASVDRDTGRLKLHMKKNYQYNTRGTKFSLPKAGKGNKYEGDILLAEDQLLYGAWNQKVRKGKSKASSQSIFGSDLASDLGCITDLTKRDDIRVGFGRKNPNSTKFGRERRGKKKKGVKDKACGLRRY